MRFTLQQIACAVMFVGSAAAIAQNPNEADRQFVIQAMEGGNAEVALGEMAAQKAASPDVKHFGEKMAMDHSKMNEQMTGVAQNMGVTPPTGVSASEKSEAEKLGALSGQAFDTAYIKDMVKDHHQDLEKFQKEASITRNPTLKTSADQGAHVIAEHLRLAENLGKAHKVNVTGQ